MSYLKRYLFRPLLIFILFLITIFLGTSIFVNIFLIRSEKKIEYILGQRLSCNLSFVSVNYLPPNFIIIKDISIEDFSSQKLCSAKKITLMLSLWQVLWDRDFVFKKFWVDAIDFEYNVFSRENINKMIEIIKSFKTQDCNIIAKDVRINSPKSEGIKRSVLINSSIAIDVQDNMSGSGTVIVNYQNSKSLPLNYRFFAHLRKNGMDIENLEIEKGQLYSKFWGGVEPDTLRLNGLLVVNNFIEDYSYTEQPKISILDRIKEVLKHKPRESGWQFLETSVLNIFDIDCLIKFKPREIRIDKCDFNLNRIPFNLNGAISFQDSLTALNLRLSSSKDIKRFDMEIMGNLKEGVFNGNMKLDFLRRTKNENILDTAEGSFTNLRFGLTKDTNIKVFFDDSLIIYKTAGNLYKLPLRNFESLVNLKNHRYKFIQIKSMIYDGLLQGSGTIDISDIPFRGNFNLSIEDVSVNEISSSLINFSQVYGKLRSDIYYRTYPNMNLNGQIVINDGYFDNLSFFKWLSGLFNIRPLTKVDFKSLSADFLVTQESSNLQNISLDSEEIKLGGYFDISADNLVSSKVSLGFSRLLMESSPQFKKLLRLLGKDVPLVIFDFQLSGIYGATNFKWLQSDLRKRINDILPGGIKKTLENDVEDAIQSIAAQ